MMKTTITSLLVLAVVALSEVKAGRLGMLRDISAGECPTITNKQDLDPVPYLGTWYEIERFNFLTEEGTDCVQAIYSDLGDGVLEVHNRARTSSGEVEEAYGTAVVLEPGVLLVDFGNTPAEYHVLDTDYTTFSAVYNCVQLEEMRFQYAWILSRNPTLQPEIYDHARQVFEDNGIDVSLFHSTYQGNDCPYI